MEDQAIKYQVLLQKLATQSQVDKLQALLQREDAETLVKLDKFIQDAELRHNKSIRRLELQRTDLTSILAHYQNALSLVSDSHNVARQVHSDISRADKERKLVDTTLQFVTQVRSLKTHIAVAHEAFSKNEYSTVARSIQQIRQLDPKVMDSQFAKRVVPSSEIPEDPSVLVNQWCEKCTKVFKTNFLDAASRQDVDQLTLTFQMFPLIGQDSLGLDLYSKYVCDIVAGQSRKIMTGENKRPGVFAQALLHLCKIVSTVINNHSQIIAACYGLHHMVHVMEKVEKEVDLQAGLVLDVFTEVRKLQRVVHGVNEWNSNPRHHQPQYQQQQQQLQQQNQQYREGSNEEAINEPITVAELSSLMTEFSQILQNWSMYSLFFSVRWYEFRNETKSPLQPPSPILNGQLTTKLSNDNFLSNFQILIVHYLQRSFRKSLSLEELPLLDKLVSTKPFKHTDLSTYPISSVLEDLSILIKRTLILTVNTGQSELLSHFLDQLAKFYQNEFLVRFMQNKFKDLHPKLASTLFLKKVDNHPNSTGTTQSSTKLSQLGFNFRGAAANALTNIQSNLQSVVSDNESVMFLRQYLIYVNTLYFNVRFVHRLLTVEILEENPNLLHDNFPFGEDSTNLSKKIGACEGLIIRQNNKLQKWCVKILFESVFLSKIRTLIHPVFSNGNEDNYISNADDFENLSSVNDFVSKWKSTMIPFQNVFCAESWAELLSLMIDTIVRILEQRVWTLRVNELGATKLDRELSLLITTVCSTNYILREKFTKLTQLVLVLGFDDDDFDVDSGDIKEEIESGMNWVISPQERIKVRSLKVDKRH
ncbi:hypothetical protein ZYGR_0I07500 [Zygosaccharomyces rouxii]|uniref:Conserved oligomeric Golgi complex subunit 4 n=2 Tax=Zygosaccharomyces rouxii TaxID=4956 RepID=C5DUL4_ZYGRC|nr:uncharacterized protein ZYRO0C17732g [Zygosaccharomyces rouxii]KAH9201354.1 COG4 transport protein-domain-containing protein [Zygosaccharomyces rouxii]GAV48453.1 hypothetical protein ZYGR_0I07500 [Zygosaccharomyces rouxii]CAR27475.1 ZYRO0C17732p [Zygosaccharomyces rouxii]